MIVLFQHTVLKIYFQSKNKHIKSTIEKELSNIINNNNVKLLFSKKYISYLDKYLEELGDEYFEDFQAFLKESFDNNKIENIKITGTCSIDEEFAMLHNNSKSNLNFTLCNTSSKLTGNICNLKKSIKPERDWLVLKLLSNNTCTVTYLDFKSDHEIKHFLDCVYSISPNISYYYILDDYFNLYHNLFQYFKNKKIPVKYYASIYKDSSKTIYNQNELKNKLTEIKRKFGINSQLYITNNKNVLHRRHILIDKFVIYSNHDFAQIKHINKNWKIDVNHDIDYLNDILYHCSQYTKIV